MVRTVILSDRTIREELAAGRIAIDPLDESAIQPSSVDLRLDRLFRVFLNHTMPVIDVKQNLEELTRLVEIEDGSAFILHPGEFVLASTLERVALPDDLVARIEGKSSLGRLGLLIHSSLPASEPLLVLDDRGLALRTIGEIVKEQRQCCVVSFDPTTFDVDYYEVTGWYEGPADRIYEVRLASGRSVHVTAAHNLFTLDEARELRKVRSAELAAGTLVAVPCSIPEPPSPADAFSLLDVVPEAERLRLTIEGPTIVGAFRDHGDELTTLLGDVGYAATSFGDRRRARLPWTAAAQLPGLLDRLGPDDRIGRRSERHSLPATITIDEDLAWLLGMYVAGGYRRARQVTISNTDQRRLDRLTATFDRLGLPVYRSGGAVTCCSSLLSDVVGWLGTGGKAATKRVPPIAFGWSDPVLRAFLGGLVDGDGSTAGGRTSVWATSEGLVADVLTIFGRLGRRAASCHATTSNESLGQGDVAWDRVVEVVDTGRVEPVYDLEVRPGGRKIENFLAGSGGVFVSNTAGFIDAGFDGHITLELSNVANLPITLYPGMKIGQVSFLRMTSPADVPYGKGQLGSKYQGQRGPTPSRYWENFS